MKLVVGLGNPGRKYDQTRHNIGFDVIADLKEQFGGSAPVTCFEGEVSECRIGDHKVLLLRPQTFMNASGQSVRKVIEFYKCSLADVVVVCDDMNLPPGRLRLRPRGSAGGQKGLADIVRQLGTDQWARLRVGIGRPPAQWQVVDFVLSKFGAGEKQLFEDARWRACRAIECWVISGILEAMNLYNRDAVE